MTNAFASTLTVLLSAFLLASCAPSTVGGVPTPVLASGPTILSQVNTINLENSDRIHRFQRLARMDGIPAPKVEQVYAPAGTVPGVQGPVPVVRVVFKEAVFFNTNSATPLPQSIPVLDLIAQNMRLDVPDAALTILGHTDSTGTDAYNVRLSARRALYVMKMLVARGVDPLQMTTVAIGDRQPIAPNDTAEGRAMNRRVEFLISASTAANLAVVQYRNVNPAYFSTSPLRPVKPPAEHTVDVLQTRRLTLHGKRKVALVPVGSLDIAPPGNQPIAVRSLAPPPTVSMRPAQEILPAQLTKIIVD